jgi:hypothetical protein
MLSTVALLFVAVMVTDLPALTSASEISIAFGAVEAEAFITTVPAMPELMAPSIAIVLVFDAPVSMSVTDFVPSRLPKGLTIICPAVVSVMVPVEFVVPQLL